MKVLLVVNRAWNVLNFRVGLVRGLQSAGHEVIVAVPPDADTVRVEKLGCRVFDLPMDNGGTQPHKDLLLLWRLHRLLRRAQPDVLLGFTVKPNVYGSIAARWAGVPVVNNIAGLGAAFIRVGLLTRVVKLLYRVALRRSQVVFFQNPDDRELFLGGGLVRESQARLLPGSGVDMAHFMPAAMPQTGRPALGGYRFLLLARLLYDKGVGEFVEAAGRLRRELPQCRFALLGMIDSDNPAAITRAQVDRWVAEGTIEYLGAADDVRPHIAAAHCVVLPSYREGVPRSLLEAAAMARPIVATDVAGCREVVRHGDNGLLCRPRDAASLADAMRQMASMPPEALAAMGRRGRERVESEFDERLIVRHYVEALDSVSPAIPSRRAAAAKANRGQ